MALKLTEPLTEMSKAKGKQSQYRPVKACDGIALPVIKI
jgi:hypothetical protein